MKKEKKKLYYLQILITLISVLSFAATVLFFLGCATKDAVNGCKADSPAFDFREIDDCPI